jgi:queuine tRNA-ribosyltransferase
MHSVNDPAVEAYRLYVDQAGIIEELNKSEEPLVIWDVGLGAATNAMACIRKLEELGEFTREVKIVSFERDLDPLRLVTTYPYLFDHVKHRAPHVVLRKGVWRSSLVPLEWSLHEGDFMQTLAEAPAPDIIWYDPFSYKVDTPLWSIDAFQSVLAATRGKATRLYTYSASTAVRSTMLVAGWFVGKGLGTGPKSETTAAYSPTARESGLARNLLDHTWLTRWERSDARQPIGAAGGGYAERITAHPQFANKA